MRTYYRDARVAIIRSRETVAERPRGRDAATCMYTDKFAMRAREPARRGSRETRTDVLEIPSLFYFSRRHNTLVEFSRFRLFLVSRGSRSARRTLKRSNKEMKRGGGG